MSRGGHNKKIGPYQKYGRLLTLRLADAQKWECSCDCGNKKIVWASNLLSGHTQSCGCFRSEIVRTHDKSRTQEYKAWTNMWSRCTTPSSTGFHNYGGRAIRVCERWSDFNNFLTDMGMRPSPRHSIDRIDVNGNYEPTNCRWAEAKQQGRNRRQQHYVTIQNRQMTLAEAVEQSGLKYNTVLYRLKRGWTISKALGHG